MFPATGHGQQVSRVSQCEVRNGGRHGHSFKSRSSVRHAPAAHNVVVRAETASWLVQPHMVNRMWDGQTLFYGSSFGKALQALC